MRVHSIMQKKDNKPPAGVGESAATRKRHEKNKIPDYENLFAGGSGGKGDSGFMMRVFRKDRWRLLYSTLLNLLQNIPPQPASAENMAQEDQQEADDTALDFVDSF